MPSLRCWNLVQQFEWPTRQRTWMERAFQRQEISPKISFGTRHLFAPSSPTLDERQEVDGLGYLRTAGAK